MNRLWLALFLLCAVFLISLGNVRFLCSLSDEVSALLTQAQDRCREGDWAQAEQITEQARSLWHSHELYLHSTLHHADIDEIHLGFQAVKGLLSGREMGEYFAANADLIGRLGLVSEQEQFNLKNLL